MAEIFEGKIAFITGGNSGIGKATAISFARMGATVILMARRSREGKNVVKTIREIYGRDATFVEGDVSKDKDVAHAVRTVVDTFGTIDYAFNNAGYLGVDLITHQYPEDEWNKVINVNLKGVWLCMKYQIDQMLRQGHGVIVNNSSANGLIASSGELAYTASKHAVIGLTKVAALEYASRGIRVNAVCPGYIYTPMVEDIVNSNPTQTEIILKNYPLGRLGVPEEVASAVIWLCSEESTFLNGTVLPIEGGLLAH